MELLFRNMESWTRDHRTVAIAGRIPGMAARLCGAAAARWLPWAGLLAKPVNPSRPVNFGIRKSESVGHHGPKPALQLQIRSSFKFWMWPRAGTDSPDFSQSLLLNMTGGPPAPQPFKLPGEATVGKKET